MFHCFLTGFAFRPDDGYVLNRRAAHDLLIMFKGRVDSLRRVVDQFAPLDKVDHASESHRGHGYKSADKRHRLVCKAVAQAIMPAYPEIELFVTWPQYRTHDRLSRLHGLRGDPRFKAALMPFDDDGLRHVERLAEAVLRAIDPTRTLPQRARLEVGALLCARSSTAGANVLTARIRQAAVEGAAAESLGLSTKGWRALREFVLAGHTPAPAPAPAPATHQEPAA